MRLLSLLAGAALLATPSYALDLAGIEAATFILYDNGGTVCSASVVYSGEDGTILLTANHCVDGGLDKFSIQTKVKNEEREVVSYTVYMADVLRKDPKSDLATLRLRDKTVRFPVTEIATAEEADAALFKGAEVLAAGYPGTMASGMEDLVYTDGLFTGVRDSYISSVEVPVYRTTSPIWYGNSGGALYTKIGDAWKLVGVATQIDPETPWDNSLWIPVAAIDKILRGAWFDGKDLSDPAYRER